MDILAYKLVLPNMEFIIFIGVFILILVYRLKNN